SATDRRLQSDVVKGDEMPCRRREIRRPHDYPGRRRGDLAAAFEGYLCGHWTIRDVIKPTVVVCVVFDGRRFSRRSRFSKTPEYNQAPVCFGTDLAQRNRDPHELAPREKGRLIGAVDRPRARINNELLPIFDCLVAARRGRFAFFSVLPLEFKALCLLIRQVNGPGDRNFRSYQLSNGVAVAIVAKDAETSSLAFDAGWDAFAGLASVFVASRRYIANPGHFWTDKKPVRAVANPGDPNRRMNPARNDFRISHQFPPGDVFVAQGLAQLLLRSLRQRRDFNTLEAGDLTQFLGEGFRQ